MLWWERSVTTLAGVGDDDLVGGFGVDSADGEQGEATCAAESTSGCEEILPDHLGVTPERHAMSCVLCALHRRSLIISTRIACSSDVY